MVPLCVRRPWDVLLLAWLGWQWCDVGMRERSRALFSSLLFSHPPHLLLLPPSSCLSCRLQFPTIMPAVMGAPSLIVSDRGFCFRKWCSSDVFFPPLSFACACLPLLHSLSRTPSLAPLCPSYEKTSHVSADTTDTLVCRLTDKLSVCVCMSPPTKAPPPLYPPFQHHHQ